MYLAKKIEL